MTAKPAVTVCSLLEADGRIRLTLEPADIGELADDQVVVEVEAAPINPSDIGQLFGLADVRTLESLSPTEHVKLIVRASGPAQAAMSGRVGVPVTPGNEGAGRVVAAGRGNAAQSLLGKTVAATGGGLYATHRVVAVGNCLELPGGVTTEQGAAAFVNPLTALGFLTTARDEGHTAIVQTAAASNLGRMMVRLCREEGMPLVNVVRSPEQVVLLEREGAQHVVDSSRRNFTDRLIDAVVHVGATIAFDAVGGGELAGTVLWAMERALLRAATGFDRYGSARHKQVYVYGGLQEGPIQLRQDVGKAWSVSGWLVTPFLQKQAPARLAELRARVVAGLRTTFASQYGERISLSQLLDADVARRYTRRATDHKFLVCPQLG